VLTAIVPAYNEERTVASVATALLDSRAFDDVVVVDDGSSDGTVEQARRSGASVYRMPQNGGKGEAMRTGVELAPGDVGFFDADLVGFGPEHARAMVDIYERGYDQVCAMRDYEPTHNLAELVLQRSITGERIVRRWILDELGDTCWRGFNIETALNYICDTRGGRTCCFVSPGVTHTHKNIKRGLWAGRWQNLKMFSRMWRAQRMLEATGGAACEAP